MIGKMLTRMIEWATREYWKARAIQAVREAEGHAIDVIRQTARDVRTGFLSDAMRSEIDQCVREHLVKMQCESVTYDIQPPDYRTAIRSRLVPRGSDYAAAMDNRVEAKRVTKGDA